MSLVLLEVQVLLSNPFVFNFCVFNFLVEVRTLEMDLGLGTLRDG